MKKVFYDYKIFYTQRYGGPSRYFLSLIDSLNKINTDALICAPVYYNEYLKDFNEYYKSKIFGKYLKKQFKYSNKILTFYNYLISSIKLNSSNCSIYHPTYYGKGLINFNKTPIVLTIHDLIHEKFKNKNEMINLDKKEYLINIASHILCVSRNTQKDLVEHYKIDINKTSVIYPGIENIFFKKNEKFSNVKTDKPFFLYVGKRNFYKNYKNFLIAYSKSKNLKKEVKIVFFGGGDLTNYEKDFILNNRINIDDIICDQGNDNKLVNYYKKAIALIYPSLYEGFGSVPFEAMNYGCPVISSNSSCLPEVQEDASEKFDPLSTDEIKNKLELVSFNEQKRSELIEKGHNLIKKYSWEKCALETQKIYEKII